MKQILFIILLLISGHISFAQFQKGTTVADMNVNVNGTTIDGYFDGYQPDGSLASMKYSLNYFQGAYTLAYNRFFNNSILWGARVGYNHSKSEETYVSTSLFRRQGVSIGPYVEKYFKLMDKLYFTLDLAPTVALYRDNHNESKSRTMTYRLSLSPGLTYLLTDRWWMSAGFGSFYYSLSRTKDVPDQGNPTIKEQNYGVFMNANSFSIGLQYVLGNRL